MMEKAAIRLISQTGFRVERERSQGKSKDEAWNECMVDLVKSAKVHCDYFVVQCFYDAIEEVKDVSLRKVLTDLFLLHSAVTLESYSPVLLEAKSLTYQDISNLQEKIRTLLKTLRKDAVCLVDSFNIPDFVLNTPLGRYDGQIYSNYLAMVKKAPNAIGRPAYWEKVIQPMVSKN
eukprot:TRINITY_DN7990_c0_g2_i1.p1 TRINITY_DN7990_c0_g2~~TRINITY_DN7990_c0_g2_i1.p1  ORF type:complete len:206 (-),score=61.98 TRINITY_DN7990_c0_g2_i1:38-565(-)